MYEKAKTKHDAFALSLGGLTTVASFANVPAVASNRLNKIQDELAGQLSAGESWFAKLRLWPRRHPQTAQDTCA